jgi:hypothetical protein
VALAQLEPGQRQTYYQMRHDGNDHNWAMFQVQQK